MREALFSQDGWGCQHVNQDTNWEVPSSPEPTNKDGAGPPMWKPSINNGTDLWESNLRNGGQPTTQQVPKPSWGHTPSSNLGGTWGEDDDGADSSSVWTGGSGSNAASGATVGVIQGGVNVGQGGVVSSGGPQWGQGVVGVGLGSTGGSGSNNLTGATGVVAGGSGNSNSTGNGWGDPREIRPLPGGGSMDIRNVDHRGGGNGSGGATSDPRDIRMIDPRDPIRGDPRGISGRLNGTSEMWGHHPQMSHNQIQNINKMVGQNVATASTNVGGTSGPGIGPGGAGPVPVSANIPTQWGPAQAVGVNVSGPKEVSKQISGWEEPSPPPQRRSIPNYDDGTSLWGQQTRVPGSSGHWKDMTDSIGRGGHLMRGQIQSGGTGIGSTSVGNSSVPVGANPNNPMNSVVGPQARLATVGSVQHKPDGGAMWVHSNNVSGRNTVAAVTTWGDDSHNVNVAASSGGGSGVSSSNWVDEKPNTTLAQNSWSEANSVGVSWGNKQSKLPASSVSSGWSSTAGVGVVEGVDLGSEWSAHGGIIGKSQQQQKLSALNVGMVNVINSEMIKQSKQYRILVDNGFKKEDVERALVTANMNIEEAADMLRANSSLAIDGWRRHEESLGSYSDHTSSTSSGGFAGRYPVGSGQMTYSHNPMSNMGCTAVTGAGNNNTNMSALQVQKYLNQGQHGVAVGPQSVGNSSGVSAGFAQNTPNVAVAAAASVNIAGNTNNQPSGQQIRMLGQQIQLAIHSGFISSQILTQPLTQTTLNLLNQLLSNIKHLQAAQQSLARGGNANPMAVNVAISKYKQQIQNLQNQINAQQAVYVKQQNMQPTSQQQQPQQPQQHPSVHLNNSGNEYLRSHDAINNLPSNFSELNINKPSGYQGGSNQQSRLNQWKLPVLDKDINSDSTEFSRAPGATKQNLTNNSSNISSLGLQNDGTWSTGRNIGDGWPDPSSDNENKDWSVAQPTSAATAYTDLVQEFEPGKPWKIKSIEDDPSITPGSVARSPLSINSTPKDADIFANTGKNSPTDLPPLSLSSSTWSFNPNQNFPSWSDNSQQCAATSELWTSPLNKSSQRGPPPGLTPNSNKTGGNGGNCTTSTPSAVTGASNGWLQARSGGVQTTNTTWTSGNTSWGSSWLLLKNLTAQIDGPTLRTLCMQHGPLVSFHLYLNQGIALCKYATREEANKAQMALNNCVLANTTIYAESPSENEVQNIMQHLPQTASSASSSGSSTGTGGGAVTPSNSGGSSSGPSLSGNSSNGNNSNGNGNTGGSGVSGGGNNGNSSAKTSGGVSNPTTSVTTSNLLGSSGGGSVSNASSGGGSGTGSVGSGTAASSNSSNGGPGSTNSVGSKSTASNVTIPGGSQSSASNLSNSTNSTWRQTGQNQTLQGQSRTSGREADFDYISLVYSIVDD
ncbi:protein Gawky isoform X2 [Drosophila ficusphila]|uniref:protein Gawky isoform X2 n=1 Tax=Drosophila ficusphila TaxID=30025 RepID=UPI0007E829E2|nr:protein Gawky isoform X2 [Drosophila ficusphila]